MHSTESYLFVAFKEARHSSKISVWDLGTYSVLDTFEYTNEQWSVSAISFHKENLLISCGLNSVVWNLRENTLFKIHRNHLSFARLKGDNLELYQKLYHNSCFQTECLQIDLGKMKKSILGKNININIQLQDAQLITFNSEMPVDSHSYSLLATQHFFKFLIIQDPRKLANYSTLLSSQILSGSKLFSLSTKEITISSGADEERSKSRKLS